MKIYIMCDLEGAAGVIDHRRQCWFDGEYYKQARQLATLELNALVEGGLEGGRKSPPVDPRSRLPDNEQDRRDQPILS